MLPNLHCFFVIQGGVKKFEEKCCQICNCHGKLTFSVHVVVISRWEIAYIVDQDQNVGLNRPPTSDFRRRT